LNNGKSLKHKAYELIEGGLHGNTAARIFSWLLIILIILSVFFMAIWDIDGVQKWHPVFEVIENFTVGVFTIELIIGFWTADLRFPNHPRPRVRYLLDVMTIVQILAILPFYLGLILRDSSLASIVKFFQVLKLLHLLKIGEIGIHAWKEERAVRAERAEMARELESRNAAEEENTEKER